jgi:carbonic anhydrase
MNSTLLHFRRAASSGGARRLAPRALVLATLVAVAALAALGMPVSTMAAEAAPPADTSASRWGYSGEPDVLPPERWGELPDGVSCGRGHHQSPIALFTSGEAAARRAPIPALTFGYRAAPLQVEDNGRFISLLCDSAGAASLAGVDAPLTRVDLHAPSEHTLDGHGFPMELEFVHRGGAGGPTMIVSVFVKAGQKNAAFDALLKALPKKPGSTNSPSGVSFDPAALLPVNHAYLDYLGSLTSPPCTEGVRWCVLLSAVEASQEQLDRYIKDPRLSHSSRPLMPTNGRAVRIGAGP